MSTQRVEHTGTLLPDGTVLVTGGGDATDTPLNTAEIFHPDSGTWTPTGNLIQARLLHVAVLLPNGKVLVIGEPTLPMNPSPARSYTTLPSPPFPPPEP